MDIETLLLAPSDFIPNHPHFPLLVYKNLGKDADSSFFEETFARNGWGGVWRNGVYSYHHYHSGAHEVLGVGRGSAKLQLGGPDGPIVDVKQGECLLLPAGTGHKKLESSHDFQVVGAYPKGQRVDTQSDAPTEAMLAKIRSLPVPDTDPILGKAGGVKSLWQRE